LFYNRGMDLNVVNIGSIAWQVWQHDQSARVMGVTSRGLFLAIEQRVLFVSFERWRGPLTINVEGPLDCVIGDRVRLSPTRLIFPATEVDLSAVEVWHPGVPSCARPLTEQREALGQLASSVLARRAPEGFGGLLLHLVDLPEKPALSAIEAALLTWLNQLRDSIQYADFDQATTLIEGLLGLGRGLTPSGDDVTIGLLLSLNRWPADRDWRELNQRVIDLAYQRTTTISANLIECAAAGEADERLINIVDGLVTGTPSRDECVECVLDWGNSSGIDALIGMALACS
jgi:hypothetical protein